MLTKGQEYIDQSKDYYAKRYPQRMLHDLSPRAQQLGVTLVPTDPVDLPG